MYQISTGCCADQVPSSIFTFVSWQHDRCNIWTRRSKLFVSVKPSINVHCSYLDPNDWNKNLDFARSSKAPTLPAWDTVLVKAFRWNCTLSIVPNVVTVNKTNVSCFPTDCYYLHNQSSIRRRRNFNDVVYKRFARLYYPYSLHTAFLSWKFLIK